MYVPVLSQSVVSNSATPWTVARQAPLSMGFSQQEQCSGLPCPPPGDLPPRDQTHVSYVSCIGRWPLYHSFGRKPIIQEIWVQSLGWEDPLEKGMAIHSSILA